MFADKAPKWKWGVGWGRPFGLYILFEQNKGAAGEFIPKIPNKML